MTKAERKIWHQAIEGLKVAYRNNITQIEGLEIKNDIIMEEVFSKIDQFEKDCEEKNN